VELRTAHIKRTLGGLGCAVDPSTCTPHQRRQSVPLPLPCFPRMGGHEAGESDRQITTPGAVDGRDEVVVGA
jgi:hypothetical protein